MTSAFPQPLCWPHLETGLSIFYLDGTPEGRAGGSCLVGDAPARAGRAQAQSTVLAAEMPRPLVSQNLRCVTQKSHAGMSPPPSDTHFPFEQNLCLREQRGNWPVSCPSPPTELELALPYPAASSPSHLTPTS